MSAEKKSDYVDNLCAISVSEKQNGRNFLQWRHKAAFQT